MSDLTEIRNRIATQFQTAFGITPIQERIQDIVAQATSLGRFTDLHHLCDEAGDLMCSVLQLCNECGWDPADLASATLAKIAARQAIRAQGVYQAAETTSFQTAPRKVAVFIGSFDPPSRVQRAAVLHLLDSGFDEVVVRPVAAHYGGGGPEHVASMHRAALADLTFGGLPRVSVDFSELDRGPSNHPIHLKSRFPSDTEVCYAVGVDLTTGGRWGRSIIQTRWEQGSERWHRDRFLVLHTAGKPPDSTDLPPQHSLIELENQVPSAELRSRIFSGDSVDSWVTPEVAEYIRRQQLFVPLLPGHKCQLKVGQPRLIIEFDHRNEQAGKIAERYMAYAGEPANLVLVIGGDGTMLHAIRKHWRLRIPFLGLNAGHLGFLANERLPDKLEGLELVTYAMPMLRVESTARSGQRTRGLAFGDAWLERDGGQAAWLRLDVDGQTRVPKIVGDGMLIATAAGSSAYARAMGGIPVPLNTPVLSLAGSNVFHPRFWKPLNLADDALVSLVNLDETGKRLVRGFLDGQPLGMVQAMEIRRSAVAGVELAFTCEFDPSVKLLRSLFPPIDDEMLKG